MRFDGEILAVISCLVLLALVAGRAPCCNTTTTDIDLVRTFKDAGVRARQQNHQGWRVLYPTVDAVL